MKDAIASLLPSLNSIGIESSLVIFRNCFSLLSYSFSNPTIAELETWIEQLKNPSLSRMWLRQRTMKHPDFILYFAMWHFRNKALQEKEYFREVHQKQTTSGEKYGGIKEITNKINRELDEFNAFEGVAFLGSLIGAWMLNYPRALVLGATNSMQNSQPNEIWLKSVFQDKLEVDESNDELELLYRLDYQLYYTFEDLEAHNTK